jgi:hypothetical protein
MREYFYLVPLTFAPQSRGGASAQFPVLNNFANKLFECGVIL